MQSRRRFLTKLTMASSLMAAKPYGLMGRSFPEPLDASLDLTKDEDFWHQIKMAYTVSPAIVNLNNGGVSPSPRVVQDAVDRYNKLSNETPSYYMWRILDKGREAIRSRLGLIAGCDPGEIAINRNASEALETAIFGIRLKAGDEVVLTKQDYPNMINAWKQREHRDGIVLKWISMDLPIEDEDEIAEQYINAFTDRTKVVHITHVINWVGQVIPAAKIATAAKARGIDVVVDGAHSFAHLVYNIPDLNADYYGTSLHKWLCAPIGTGMLWVRKEKIKSLYPLFGAPDPESEDIRKFESLGTRSFPIEQGIGQAIDFHQMLGAERKFRRLHYLKNYWMERTADVRGIHFNTSMDPRFGGAIGSFSLEGKEIGKITGELLNKYQIHTTGINWENIHGVRVSPNVYTVTTDLDRFIEAVKKIAAD